MHVIPQPADLVQNPAVLTAVPDRGVRVTVPNRGRDRGNCKDDHKHLIKVVLFLKRLVIYGSIIFDFSNFCIHIRMFIYSNFNEI